MSPTPPRLPHRAARRAPPCRAQTILFWTIFALFVAMLCYLGLLAFSGGTGGVISRAVIHTSRLAECLVVLCAVAAVAAAIASRNHLH